MPFKYRRIQLAFINSFLGDMGRSVGRQQPNTKIDRKRPVDRFETSRTIDLCLSLNSSFDIKPSGVLFELADRANRTLQSKIFDVEIDELLLDRQIEILGP